MGLCRVRRGLLLSPEHCLGEGLAAWSRLEPGAVRLFGGAKGVADAYPYHGRGDSLMGVTPITGMDDALSALIPHW